MLEALCSPNECLFNYPLPSPDLTIFVDGSSVLGPDEHCKAAYVVVTTASVLEANCRPEGITSQKAEILALIRALIPSKVKQVNIYTDSKYAF